MRDQIRLVENVKAGGKAETQYLTAAQMYVAKDVEKKEDAALTGRLHATFGRQAPRIDGWPGDTSEAGRADGRGEVVATDTEAACSRISQCP